MLCQNNFASSRWHDTCYGNACKLGSLSGSHSGRGGNPRVCPPLGLHMFKQEHVIGITMYMYVLLAKVRVFI